MTIMEVGPVAYSAQQLEAAPTDMLIEELNLTFRVYNLLTHAGIDTVAQLTERSGELFSIHRFGLKSFVEVVDALSDIGLSRAEDRQFVRRWLALENETREEGTENEIREQASWVREVPPSPARVRYIINAGMAENLI
jgi:hypothetical protein